MTLSINIRSKSGIWALFREKRERELILVRLCAHLSSVLDKQSQTNVTNHWYYSVLFVYSCFMDKTINFDGKRIMTIILNITTLFDDDFPHFTSFLPLQLLLHFTNVLLLFVGSHSCRHSSILFKVNYWFLCACMNKKCMFIHFDIVFILPFVPEMKKNGQKKQIGI